MFVHLVQTFFKEVHRYIGLSKQTIKNIIEVKKLEIIIINQKSEIIANIKIDEKLNANIIWDKDYRILINGTYQEIKD